MSVSRGSRWEYLVLPRTQAERLNELGQEGWELVGVSGDGASGELFLKRPLPGFREQITLDQRQAYVEEAEQ